MKPLLIAFFISLISLVQAQVNEKPTAPIEQNLVEHIPVENIGPTVFGGRVVDLAVNPDQPSEFYVAYASGGLWHTINNGTTFDPIFDHESVITIGDIDVHWPTRTIYLGSGEVNSSRSSYAGNGVYKTTDNGKNWEYLGLPESHHIGRVIIDKNDPNIVNVAVLGHLYTPNRDRGMYLTKDGGKTWSQTLYVNDNTGAVDLIVHPRFENILYAAMWQRTRRAWNFTESGSGSGIYKSTNGGQSWTLISVTDSAFPQGDGTGRIGLAIYSDKEKTKVYAILDNYNRRPVEKGDKKKGLQKNDFAEMAAAEFAKLKDSDLTKYLEDNNFEEHVVDVKKMVAEGKIMPKALKEYVEDANRLLFDTPVVGAEIYTLQEQTGKWNKTHEGYLDGLFNSYGYYFAQIRVNPKDADQLYVMGVPILRSDDAGATWKNVNGQNVHVDHHALWINPSNPNHIINGNDGGVNISYDAGQNWVKCTSPPVGQFYYVNIDGKKQYNVYGGTQDNGVWVGNKNYKNGVRWQMTGSYPYETIIGGDGMQVQIDSRDNNTVYTGFQFGNYFRINSATKERKYITPKHKLGDRPYRWNWQSPILLSSHNEDIVYFGAHKLLRSMDKGETFKEISEDLTFGGKKGDVAFGTLTTISESELQFGLIYVGTDDGRVHVTGDGGVSWKDISEGLPDSLWISRVFASAHDKNTVYCSVNGYRNDVFEPYVYMSNDQGSTWKSIAANLPAGPVNVIKEDPTDKQTLYVGTDHGSYISMDKGLTYMKIGNMPNVPVHDMVVNDRNDDLIIGTHGRSIYLLNVKTLKDGLASGQPLYVSKEGSISHNTRWGSKRRQYSKVNEPEYTFSVFSKEAGNATLTVTADGKEVATKTVILPMGVSNVVYDLTFDAKRERQVQRHNDKNAMHKEQLSKAKNDKYYLLPGAYEVSLKIGSHTAAHQLNIK